MFHTHTHAFTHRRIYTQTLLHTNAFTHRRFHTQTRLHTAFDDRTSFCAKGLRGTLCNHNFTSVFDDRTSFRAKRCAGQQGTLQFTAIFDDQTSFPPKGLRGTLCNRNFPSVFGDRIVRKGCAGQVEIAILPQLLTIEPRFVRKGCVSRRLVGTARAPAFSREIEKKERARGQEEKMWRCEGVKMRRFMMRRWADVKMSRCEDGKMRRWEDVKMRRCEDEKMLRWEDVKMWRWEDVKTRRCEVRRCEDEKMWRWEDEIQTPTIGRTLRSNALGKNHEGTSLHLLICFTHTHTYTYIYICVCVGSSFIELVVWYLGS